MSQKIRIKLKSYDFNLVDKSAEKIVKTVKTTGAIVTGPIPLPTHKKIFTVIQTGVYIVHFDPPPPPPSEHRRGGRRRGRGGRWV